ncbi:methyltransferase family protein [Actinoplanes solisilvae]|uniref:methyltransferase family protein n=1 Tax=Actinoplanes solisilvae TaxID=2486853 RepID=UPI001F0BCDCB|nr:isoprenylcysteine carboxylmethyltransferase family protein [Actinoplanes solisilvae]
MSLPTDADRGARVSPVPPPLYYVAGFVAGLLLHAAAPLPLGGRPGTIVAGAVVAALGVVLTAGGVRAVIRHRTTIVPHHPVAALVTTGAYRLSRNPMYAGLALLYVGGALLAGSWWPLVLLPLALAAVRYLVIGPEERYLAERFGEEYDRYRAGVRRWL